MLKNNKGFSLIELMVVVAIIGILASFAIPQYQSFQAKARQKEGQTLLQSYYTASKATEAEGGYPFGNFEAIGYQPTGQVHYRIVAADGLRNPTTGPDNAACVTTSIAACTAGFKLWNNVEGGTFGGAAATGCAAAINSNNSTFLTCASAFIRPNPGADVDTWSVNQLKFMNNNNSGVN